ncbi:MAG TPA: AsmA family protein [Candidatus Binatia bacterium]|nr:AsmA family protein [Candidatus Binatia bacterium]
MIRRLLLGVAILVLLAGLAVAVGALFLGRLLTANREALLTRLQATIGRPLHVGDLSVSWWGGLGVRLTAVEIGEDPAFDREPFIRAAAVTARVAWRPLLQRRLEVGSLTLATPVLRIIRAADGRWNYEGLTRRTPTAPPPASTQAAGGAAAFSALIDAIAIHDATVVIDDRSQSPPFRTTLHSIDVRLRHVALETPIDFALSAAADAERPNISLTGTLGPLSQRDRLPVQVRGALGPFRGVRAAIDALEVEALLSRDAVDVAHLRGDTMGGHFDLSGSIALSAGGPVSLAGRFDQISLAQLLTLRPGQPPIAIDGAAAAQIDLTTQANADFARALNGTIAVTTTRGSLRQFNVVRELLDRVARLPGLAQLLAGRVKSTYSRLLTAPDTRFERASATLHFIYGRATTNDLALVAEDFTVRASGWFNVDRDIDVSGSLMMSKRFSDDIVADVTEAKYVVDDNGQLGVPFRLRGRIGEAKPKPDDDALAQMAERALSRGAATDLLNKFLGGRRRPDRTPSQSGDTLQHKLKGLFGH